MSIAPGAPDSVEPKPWQTGLAPAYIGMFLWVAFLDQVGRRALPVGGLRWSCLGALAGALACYLLLFRWPATWGQRSGRPLVGVAESTFGERGSKAVPGFLLALGHWATFALAVGYAVDLTFRGLAVGGLVDPRSLRPVSAGGATLPPPLMLATALFWSLATALVGLRFTRWIAALMQSFPIFPAAALGLAMVGSMGGLRSFSPTGVDPLSGATLPEAEGARLAFALTFQWVFAFSAMACLAGADWGAGSVAVRDVRVGGLVGVALAPSILAALALMAAAGHQGTRPSVGPGPIDRRLTTPNGPGNGSTIQELAEPGRAPTDREPGLSAPPYTLRAVLVGGGFDRRIGSAMLMVLGLASLAPAAYASFGFGERLAAIGPSLSRTSWTILGAGSAWLGVVAGWSERPGVVFDLLGAAFAPVAGAIAADYALRRGHWTGPRRGINPPGLIAWGLGAAVGLLPTIGRLARFDRPDRLQPAALWGFVAAFVVYGLFALARLESPQVDAGRAD